MVPFESDQTIIRSGSDGDAWLWGLGKGLLRARRVEAGFGKGRERTHDAFDGGKV